MVTVAGSALKHGLAVEDIVHAYRNPLRAWALDEGLTMIIGGTASGELLEVAYVAGDRVDVIVHAMRARPKFLG
jgi:hypothetical protein